MADNDSARKVILNKFSASASSALDLDRGDLPGSLYHFTDAAGMMGIIQWGTLWSTLVTGLNDRSELFFGVDVLKKLLMKDGWKDGPAHDAFCSDVAGLLSIDEMVYPGHGPFLPFVTSFCAREDLAVQWLHYGRSGTGCALAFEPSKLAQSPFGLRRVRYDPSEQHRVAEAVLQAGWAAITDLRDGGLLRPIEAVYLIRATASYLWEAAVCFKHPSFADEREWRLITVETIEPMDAVKAGGVNLPMHYRLCSGRIVPYLEIEYHPPPLKEVVLGASDPHLDDDAGLKYLLKRCNQGTVPVRRSVVLVRPCGFRKF